MKTIAQLYKYHTANLGRIEDALDRVELHLRRAVAKEDRKSQKALLPLYSLMIGASAETQLMKLLYEPAVFTAVQQQAIIDTNAHLERWHRLLDCAIRNHHNLNDTTPISADTVPATDFLIFNELNNLLEDELKIVIELRNKLAHGQWEYPFTDDFADIVSVKKHLLDKENLLTLKFKRSILKNLLFMIRDLAVSRRTSHRDFDAQHQRMTNAQRNLRTRSYEKYKKSLIERKTNGRAKELANYAKHLPPPTP